MGSPIRQRPWLFLIASDPSRAIRNRKAVREPRPESERLVGIRLDPQVVLDDLRVTKGVEPSTGLALPNSGLTVRLLGLDEGERAVA